MNNETIENKILRLQQEYIEMIDKINSIKELEDLKVTATREIKTLKNKLSELTKSYEKNEIKRDEFTEESQNVSLYINLELFKINKLDNIKSIFDTIKEKEDKIESILKEIPKTFQERNEKEDLTNKLKKEIEELKKVLPIKISENMVYGPEKLSSSNTETGYETATTKENHSNGYSGLKKETIDLLAEIKEIESVLKNTTSKEVKKRLNNRINAIANEINDAYYLMTTPLGQELRELENGKEPEKLAKNNLSVEAEIEMQEKKRKLSDAERTRKKLIEKREDLKGKLKQEINEEKNKKNNNDDFDENKENDIIEESLPKIVNVDNQIIEIEEQIKKLDKKIKKYKKDKELVEKQSLEAYALGISYLEYKNIIKELEKNNNKKLNEIFEKKNLGDVLHKRGRTKDERKRLKEARNEIFKEMIEHHKKIKQIKSIENILNMIFDSDITDIQRKKKPRILSIPKDNINELEYNISILNNGEKYSSIGLRNIVLNKVEQPKEEIKQQEHIEVKEQIEIKEPSKKESITAPIEIKEKDQIKQPIPPITITSKPKEKLIQIKDVLEKIIKDYEIGESNAKRYQRGHLKVSDSFRREMHSGNFLYNIVHLLAGDVKMNMDSLTILSNEIISGESVEKLMNDMKGNIDSLSNDETEALWEKYSNKSLDKEKLPQVVQMVIDEKMNEYGRGKIDALTIESTHAYTNLFIGRNIIDELDKKSKESIQEKEIINRKKEAILYEMLKNINIIKTNKIKAKENLYKNLLKDNNNTSKLNIFNSTIAIDHEVDSKYEILLRNYEVNENEGRIEGNYQKTVNAFIEQELLLEENANLIVTENKKSSKKLLTPIEKAIKYSSNPFIRDMYTSLADLDIVVSLIDTNRINALTKHEIENKKTMKQTPNAYAKIQSISNNSDTYFKGMQVQIQDDETNENTTSVNIDEVFQKISEINENIYKEIISKREALKQITNLKQESKTTLQDIINKCYDSLVGYRKIKPQFDLDNAEKSLQKVYNNTSEANDLNKKLIDINEVEANPLGINPEILSAIPSELYKTLLNNVSSTALIGRIESILKNKYSRI